MTFRSVHEALCDMTSLVLMYDDFYLDGRSTGLTIINNQNNGEAYAVGDATAGMNGQKAQDFAVPFKRTEQLKADILAIHKVYWSMGIPTAQTTISPHTWYQLY